MFDKLAQELREARSRSGFSLQQLANKTRIDIKFLQAIEDGNFSFLPDLYVKAFLKEYARLVGLNELTIIKKYQAIKEGKAYYDPDAAPKEPLKKKEETSEVSPDESGSQKLPDKAPEQEIRREPPRPTPATTKFDSFKGTDYSENNNISNQRNMIILGGVAVILILFALVYYFFIRESNEIIVPEKSYEEIVQENSNRYSDLEPKKDNSNSGMVASDSLHLSIRSNDTSWVKIIIDNTRLEEFILFPRGQKQITAAVKYKIVFGNAKSIQLELNNKPLEFSNQGKKVVSVSVDSGGVHYDVSTDKKTNQ